MAKKAPPPPRKGRWENITIPLNVQPEGGETDKVAVINVMLRRWTGPRHPMVPRIDPGYVFREDLVAEVARCAWPPNGYPPLAPLFSGPKGCGKSSIVKQIAARCNVPVWSFNCNVGTTVRQFKGRGGARDGSTVFHEGIVTQAMEAEVGWLVIDEVSAAAPPVAMALFPVFEPDGDVALEDAEPPRYIKRSKWFRVFATDNTIGADQEETRFNYAGTNPDVNEAFLDRFGGVIPVDYLPAALEYEAVLGKVPEVDPDVLEGIIRSMGLLRQSTIDYAFSTRAAINWAMRCAASALDADGQTRSLVFADSPEVVKVAGPAFLNGMRSKLERTSAIEIISRVFPTSSAPVPPTPRAP